MALETCLGEVDMLTLERVINVLVEWKADDVQECLNVGIGKAEEPFTYCLTRRRHLPILSPLK